MKRLRTARATFISFIIAGVILLLGCNPQPKNVSKEMTKANLKFMEAFNNGDAAAVAANYTDSAKVFPPNSDVIMGRKAIENFWKNVMTMGIKKVNLETVSAVSYGNHALEEGRYKLYIDGDTLIDQGKYIVSWKMENGQWKLDRDIWNTSNPLPTPK
jgi:ketosteroid isomerase-like protein